jgi:hypothetical protein
MKDFHAPGEASNPPNKTTSSSKQESLSFCPFGGAIFAFLDPNQTAYPLGAHWTVDMKI